MNKPKIALRTALSLAFFVAAHAVAAPDDIVPMTYEDTVSDMTPATLSSVCPINIVQVFDQRLSKEGISTAIPVVASAPEPWIHSGLDRLKAYGFTVQHNSQPVANAVNLNVRLIRAYTWNVDMRINGMVALDVDVLGSNGQRTEKIRAAGSKSNIWGAKSEYVTALNYSFNHALHKMAHVLQSECTQARLAMR